MLVGVSDQGVDDRGRPGALGFHALFVTDRAYRRVGCGPFPLASALRAAWGPGDEPLSALELRVRPFEPAGPAVPPASAVVARIVEAMARGRRVAVGSAEPVEELAQEVWRRLPGRVRRRAGVATFAFRDAAAFDLAAYPRLHAGSAGGRVEVVLEAP
jgi:hypothetical protein